MVSDIEPIFDASPVLRGPLGGRGGRRTEHAARRRFAGGSLKIVAAKAPRNLRRHTARVLIVDEADAMEVGAEGNPIRLGERRTLTFANRKIIIGSTPVFEDASHVLRSYGERPARLRGPVPILRRVHRDHVVAHRLAGGNARRLAAVFNARTAKS